MANEERKAARKAERKGARKDARKTERKAERREERQSDVQPKEDLRVGLKQTEQGAGAGAPDRSEGRGKMPGGDGSNLSGMGADSPRGTDAGRSPVK